MSDIEREEFEQAVTDRWSDSYSFTRFGNEDYYDEVLEGMWWAWQASRQALSSWSEIPNSSGHASADVWIKCSDRLPNLGQRVILKSRGVVQNYMPVFDQGGDDRGMSNHFWDFEDINKIDNPLVDFEKDCWMPKPNWEQDDE